MTRRVWRREFNGEFTQIEGPPVTDMHRMIRVIDDCRGMDGSQTVTTEDHFPAPAVIIPARHQAVNHNRPVPQADGE